MFLIPNFMLNLDRKLQSRGPRNMKVVPVRTCLYVPFGLCPSTNSPVTSIVLLDPLPFRACRHGIFWFLFIIVISSLRSVHFKMSVCVFNFLQKTDKNKSTWVFIVESRIHLFDFWRKRWLKKINFIFVWPLMKSKKKRGVLLPFIKFSSYFVITERKYVF